MSKFNLPLFQTYEEEDGKLVRNPVKPLPVGAPVAPQPQVVAPQEPVVQETTKQEQPVSVASDNSDYIRQMYQAQTDAALASLKSAYDQNMARLDRTAAQIPGTYQDARNQVAATSAQTQRNFDTAAAAAGLSNGTSAQARLATSVARQNNLGALQKAEADALAEIELQRTSASNEYENAIAQAKANGNYQLAAALYEEALRVEEYYLAQEQAKIQQTQQQSTPALDLDTALKYYEATGGDRTLLDAVLPQYGITVDTGSSVTYGPGVAAGEWPMNRFALEVLLQRGDMTQIQAALDKLGPVVNAAQAAEVEALLSKYGL